MIECELQLGGTPFTSGRHFQMMAHRHHWVRKGFLLSGAIVVLALVAAGPSPQASKPFVFHKDDVVAVLGNGLADRMQHSPWVEAALQSHLKGLNVRFRDMGFSGDTVKSRPRSKGFTSEEDYLRHVAPTVIFMMFGYNESFAGPGGASEYEKQLAELVERYRGLRKKEGVDARFVLFSPIAYESTGNPHLPDGTKHNANLAAFAQATERAAEATGATFVDLYTPTAKLFAARQGRFTVNGIHLNDAGYRELASIISQSLLGKPAPSPAALRGLYAAALDKNWHWHNRYRATDGNDIWGTRAGLSFVNKQTNADVLKHELVMLDAMTANRDAVIWAAANGRSMKPDDSNVPAPVPVISNVGGKSKSSDKGKEGAIEYLSPEESRKQIQVPEGFELNVFASEEMFPGFANPVQMQVDAKGRLWAACWNTYPKWEPLDEMNDALWILEDTNRDGVADKAKIFAYVHNPLGFEFWGGGVIVTSGPDLLFLRDTNGDDKADERIILLQGLGTEDTHHAANNLIYGPDGGIYWQSGIFLVHNHESPWKPNLNIGNSGMYRFDPRTFIISPHAGNSPNPHGTAFDYWGYCYANDGTGGRSYQVRPEKNGFKMHELLTKEFRPVAADEILSSEHFPDDMEQDFLICNTIGFLGVKQYDLDRDGNEDEVATEPEPKKGKKGKGGRRALGVVWGTPVKALLESKDRNFRPTDAIVGEDGALYVSDWQNVIIGHMQHNIRDPARDHKHGRIFRLTAKGRPLQKPVAIHGQPIEALLENLKHPVNGVRHRTRVELSTRDSREVIAATQKWMASFDPNDEKEAHHLLEALWLHQQHGVKNEALLNKLLSSSVKHAVVAANTVKHFWHNVDPLGSSDFAAPAPEEFVKFDPPKHLGPAERKQYELGSVVYQREAHCGTCHLPTGQGNGVTYPSLVGTAWVNGNEERLVKLALHGMWGKLDVHGKTFDPALGVPPMTAFRDLLNDEEMAAVLTFVRNSWGNKASPVSPATVKAVRAATSNRSTVWDPAELLASHPLEPGLDQKPVGGGPESLANTVLEEELLAAKPAELAQIAMREGNVARGKTLFYKSPAACFSCHDPPAGTVRLGPDLATMPKAATPEELVEAILRPSKQIDPAYAQVTVMLNNGKSLTGIRLSDSADSIVLKEVTKPEPQTIPKSEIDEVVESKISSMPAGLVKMLKNRAEFNDLMKYVLELRKR
jgi:putative membrane-bound dehydrogenase-like protein